MAALSPVPGSFQIDATVGGGGHALRILEAATPGGRLLGLDADPARHRRARRRGWRAFGERGGAAPGELRATRRRSRRGHGLRAASTAILFDLGLSSYQLADAERGFSFRSDGPLDMRFDTDARRPGERAARDARRGRRCRPLPPLRRGAARAAHRARHRRRARRATPDRDRPTSWPRSSSVPRRAPGPAADASIPATRVFQALRIAVNRELEVAAGGARGGGRPAAARTAASSSSATTRWRTAS